MIIKHYLVGGLEHSLFFDIFGISSSRWTFIFSRGVGIPPTSYEYSLVISDSCGSSPCFMGNSTISMAIFHSYVSHYQRVTTNHYCISRFIPGQVVPVPVQKQVHVPQVAAVERHVEVPQIQYVDKEK